MIRCDLRFGTDGWRALIAGEFTFRNVERLARATARHWTKQPPPGTLRRVVMGFDSRFLSEEFALRAARVFQDAGFEVLLADRLTPTPAISRAAREHRAAGGVMITASHNPPRFNGFKVRTHVGNSPDDEYCRGIEQELEPADALPVRAGSEIAPGSIQRVDFRRDYLAGIRRQIDVALLRRTSLRVVHDAMFGVGAGCFARLLAGTGCEVTERRSARDAEFGGINPEPLAENCLETSRWLRRNPQDLCLVTDGDADRIGALDGRGGFITGNDVVALVLYHLLTHRKGRGRIVRTINTTSMVDSLCETAGVPVTEVPVGFKHVAAEMLRGDVLLGVEESGSVGFGDGLPDRDGLRGGMMLLELLATEGVPVRRILDRLQREHGRRCYRRIKLELPPESGRAVVESCRRDPPARLGRSVVERVNSLDGIKFTARNGSWLMLRASGTEPGLRIYAEGADREATDRLLAQGVALVRSAD
ncbi:MAG: phosphoglucomutase/phosphomannomutase family protein [Limisphaerales bacterium]